MFEETGLHAEFESVLAFRHGHRGLFGKSDLFFVVRMKVKPGTDTNNLRAQVRDGIVILGSPSSGVLVFITMYMTAQLGHVIIIFQWPPYGGSCAC